ncbi:MAG: RsmE family RNA methyltransferase, partial [Flavisolibacter sp.]
ELTTFKKAIELSYDKRYIAHCEDSNRQSLSTQQTIRSGSQLILIGPEGDFTHEEIELALQNNFTPVSLGHTRLRTETAGFVACTLLSLA